MSYVGGPLSRLEPLSLIAEGLGPERRARLYVGDQVAASDPDMLRAAGVGAVVNCAYDLDVNYVDPAAPLDHDRDLNAAPPAPKAHYGYAPLRVVKVGLIDGPGNHPSSLYAACHAIEGLLCQRAPATPQMLGGPHNVMIHCRAGMSRSVTVAALYLYARRPRRWPDFEGALNHVRERRGFPPEYYDFAPTQGMRDLARALLTQLRSAGRGLFG